MRTGKHTVAVVVALTAVWITSNSVVHGARPTSKQAEAAQEAVNEALHREVFGLNDERGELLSHAKQQSPDFAPARWHLGEVRVHGEWHAVEAIPAEFKDHPKLVGYLKQRQQHGDDLAGHLALAKWCHENKLVGQERAHLERVLHIDPDHPVARGMLGYDLVGGRWMLPAKIGELTEQAKVEQAALKKWRPRIERILKALDSRSVRTRDANLTKLAALDDPEAIPAVEQIAAAHSEPAAGAAIDCLAAMPQARATRGLALLAVDLPWPAARKQAAGRLKQRQAEVYVPLLLGELKSPIESTSEVLPAAGQRMVYRMVLRQEQHQHFDLVMLDRSYRRQTAVGNTGEETMAVALASLGATDRQRAGGLAQVNLQTALRNQRIMQVLKITTGQDDLEETAQAWWRWWDVEQGVLETGPKPVRKQYRFEEIKLADRPVPTGGADGEDSGNETTGPTTQTTQPSPRTVTTTPQAQPAPPQATGPAVDPRLARTPPQRYVRPPTNRQFWRTTPGTDPRTVRQPQFPQIRTPTNGLNGPRLISQTRGSFPSICGRYPRRFPETWNYPPTTVGSPPPSVVWSDINRYSFDLQYGVDLVQQPQLRLQFQLRQQPLPAAGFAPETTVWTQSGEVEIGQLEVGDLVLSQHPQTGELAYKPVVAVAANEVKRLHCFKVGYREVCTVGSQAFWVVGEGWRRADELAVGDSVHHVAGSDPVNPAQQVEAYTAIGVIVADFHTLLIGPQKLLAHDQTHRQPTTTIVPGLAAN